MSSGRSRSGGIAIRTAREADEEVLAEAPRRAPRPRGRGWSRRSGARRPAASRARRCARTRGPGGSAAGAPGPRAAAPRSRRGTACRGPPARGVRAAAIPGRTLLAEQLALGQRPAPAPRSSPTRSARSRRGLCWWMMRATRPLPVPGSPSISTEARDAATWRICSVTRAIARERPASRSTPKRSSSCSSTWASRSARRRCASPRSSTAASRSRWSGRGRTSAAPARNAATTRSAGAASATTTDADVGMVAAGVTQHRQAVEVRGLELGDDAIEARSSSARNAPSPSRAHTTSQPRSRSAAARSPAPSASRPAISTLGRVPVMSGGAGGSPSRGRCGDHGAARNDQSGAAARAPGSRPRCSALSSDRRGPRGGRSRPACRRRRARASSARPPASARRRSSLVSRWKSESSGNDRPSCRANASFA